MKGEPSYKKLYREGQLERIVEEARARMRFCTLCPHQCRVDRIAGEVGVCGVGRKAIVAGYNAHYGEERPLVGQCGSGTIFFSSCNLFCSFCQNYDISHYKAGVEVEPAELATMMTALAEKGCHNINFVTPSHVVPQILEGILIAAERGLSVPLVYNTGGYDSSDTLAMVSGVFDIYMPDFKFWDNKWAQHFCRVSDYRERVIAAITEMHRQVGNLALDDSGIAFRGLLIRHLVMPGGVAGTADVMKFLSEKISPATYVNIMDQYRPCFKAERDRYIHRRIRPEEYREALDAALSAGLRRLDSLSVLLY